MANTQTDKQNRRRKRQLQLRRRIGTLLLFVILFPILFFIIRGASSNEISAKTTDSSALQAADSAGAALADKAASTDTNAADAASSKNADGKAASGSDRAASWNLILVNPKHALPDDFEEPELMTVYGQYQVDARCYDALIEMLDDCTAAGNSPLICSAWRSHEKQTALYEEQAQKLMSQGYSRSSAYTKAGTSVALPGTSEHELGLAVDLVDETYQLLDEAQEETSVQQWLMAHSWEYGFILRYPTDKSDITGIIYEPWHYRYVGRDAAREMHEKNLCLEEYLEQ